MKRPYAAAALGALLALTLPATPATACTPALPGIDVSDTRVAAGATIRVSGERSMRKDGKGPCDFLVPTHTPTPSATVEPTPSESPTPLVTLPPLRLVAHAQSSVHLTIAPWDGTGNELPKRNLGDLPERLATTATVYHGTFAGSVTLPGNLVLGEYVVAATGSDVDLTLVDGQRVTLPLFYGYAWITVVDPLAASGGSDTTTRLALLVLLTGAGTVALNRRLARR